MLIFVPTLDPTSIVLPCFTSTTTPGCMFASIPNCSLRLSSRVSRYPSVVLARVFGLNFYIAAIFFICSFWLGVFNARLYNRGSGKAFSVQSSYDPRVSSSRSSLIYVPSVRVQRARRIVVNNAFDMVNLNRHKICRCKIQTPSTPRRTKPHVQSSPSQNHLTSPHITNLITPLLRPPLISPHLPLIPLNPLLPLRPGHPPYRTPLSSSILLLLPILLRNLNSPLIILRLILPLIPPPRHPLARRLVINKLLAPFLVRQRAARLRAVLADTLLAGKQLPFCGWLGCRQRLVPGEFGLRGWQGEEDAVGGGGGDWAGCEQLV